MLTPRFILFLAVLGCARNHEAPSGGRVTGTVAHQGHLWLPVDAVVEVQLVDLSRADTTGRIVAQSVITPMGRLVPLPFELRYRLAAIEPSHSYAVRATIRSGGFLLYTMEPHVPVLTQGNPTHVKLKLTPPRDSPKSEAEPGDSSFTTGA